MRAYIRVICTNKPAISSSPPSFFLSGSLTSKLTTAHGRMHYSVPQICSLPERLAWTRLLNLANGFQYILNSKRKIGKRMNVPSLLPISVIFSFSNFHFFFFLLFASFLSTVLFFSFFKIQFVVTFCFSFLDFCKIGLGTNRTGGDIGESVGTTHIDTS